jgi:DNA mismatch repair protein MutL
MSKIRILSEILSNKIAAGEVIERPAAVVKELCENSLDAGSKRIIIEIEKGGKFLIRVSDDGDGMGKDDALLSVERYATSKLFEDKDLFSIGTLGFRGEALPSIASVSKFTLITREKKSQSGVKIYIEGGKIKNVSDYGAPHGAMIEVKDLFFNTPARRKFLKSINTETGHIADIISAMALNYYDVSFTLIHNGRRVKELPRVSDPFERIVSVLGNSLKNKLFKIDFKSENVSVSGWVASPDESKKSSKGIYLFVNGRFVRDRIINYAIFEGFKGRLVKGRYPASVIFLNVPLDTVDVNVHPAKQEVRFSNQNEVIYAVKEGVFNALSESEKFRWAEPYKSNDIKRGGRFVSEPKSIFAPEIKEYDDFPFTPVYKQDYQDELPPIKDKFDGLVKNQIEAQFKNKAENKIKNDVEKNKKISYKNDFASLNIIGQFMKTYILCEADKALILIDQHAAHERIIFETLKKNRDKGAKASQRLLMPEIIETNFSETEVLKEILPDFIKMGMDIEPFGENVFAVRAVPAILASKGNIDIMIKDIAEKIIDKNIKAGLEDVIDTLLIEMACHGAIKANQTLSYKEIKALLRELDECGNPSNCPHGRPVWIKFTKKELEKMFKRIV